MSEARLDLIKIEAFHCFMCGNLFENKPDKTLHHAIPKFLKPKRNITIPVCSKCHKKISTYNIQSIPNFKSLRNFIDSMEDILNKYKKKLERYENER